MVNVSANKASTTWYTPNDAKDYTIEAHFSGHDPGGSKIYSPSDGSDTVTVDYLDVPITLQISASPQRPYINGKSYVRVTAKEQSTGNLARGGSITFTSGGIGICNPPTAALQGGRAFMEWNAPSSSRRKKAS